MNNEKEIPITEDNKPISVEEAKSLINSVNKSILQENIEEKEIDIEPEDIEDFINSLKPDDIESLLYQTDDKIDKLIKHYKEEKEWKRRFWSKENKFTHQDI